VFGERSAGLCDYSVSRCQRSEVENDVDYDASVSAQSGRGTEPKENGCTSQARRMGPV